jgi:Xaa-Pro aminopeptidase
MMPKTMQDAMGNLPLLERLIGESPFDAVVAISPENVRYVADVHISTQQSIRDRLAMVVWAKGHAPVFVVCLVEEGYVRANSWVQDIRSYKEFVVSPVDLLADVLAELGLSAGRVGMELDYFATSYQRKLEVRLPQLKLEPCDALFARARMFKTPREMATLFGGYQQTGKALMATYLTTAEGETERSMMERLSAAIIKQGADSVAFAHINAGPNTGYPHMTPSAYQVKPGDLLKADVGGFYHEYFSNIGRTAKFGPLTAEDRDIWKRLREIHHAVAEMLRPGNTGRQAFALATKLHEKHRIPFPYAHNGHSIGLNVHEKPILGPHEDTPYEAGMVSTCETRYRVPGKFGYHIEDIYEITATGPVLRSTAFDNEEILVV